MASSPGFGSLAYYVRAVHTRFPYGSGLSPLACSMLKLVGSFFNRHAVAVLLPLLLLVNIWFQVYFTALTGLLFTFPSRYLFTIGLKEYLALPVSSGKFPRAIRVSRYSRIRTKKTVYFRLQGYHLLGLSFPEHSSNKLFFNFSDINITFLPNNPRP